MIREIRDNSAFKDNYKEFSGLSTDSKPTDVGINSLFYELNTKKVFYWNGTTWKEIGS